MPDPQKNQHREALERKLAETVAALRALHPEGNITLRVAESGDFVAILRVTDEEAVALAHMLGSR